MSKYVNNAIFFLCTAAILVLCIGSYLGANTIGDISKAAVEALPFGGYLWDAYSVLFVPSSAQNATQVVTQPISLTVLGFVEELVKLMIAWLIYRWVMRNAVGILMMAYCDGSGSFWDKIQYEVFYSIGFVISSLLANYLLVFVGGLFKQLGSSLTVILVQIAAYGIFAVGCALIIGFVITQRFFQRTVFGAILEGIARLFLSATFFMFIHYLGENKAISYQLAVIIVMAIGVTLIVDSIESK